MENFGLNGGIPGSLIPKVQLALFANKVWKLLITSFSSVLGSKKNNFDSLWEKLKTKARHLNPVDGDQIVDFITNLDQHNKMFLLLGGLQLQFDDPTANYQKISCCSCWKNLQDLHGKLLVLEGGRGGGGAP